MNDNIEVARWASSREKESEEVSGNASLTVNVLSCNSQETAKFLGFISELSRKVHCLS